MRQHARWMKLFSMIGIVLGWSLFPVTAGNVFAEELSYAVHAEAQYSYGIAEDGTGGSVVTGNFSDRVTFGMGEPNETTLSSRSRTYNLFVARYDFDGTLLWATQAEGWDIVWGEGIVGDGAGGCTVTGRLQGTAIFGAGELNETTLTSEYEDMFVARYDANGMLLWATKASGISSQGTSIAADGFGGSVVTGIFRNTTTFGPGELNETSLTSVDGSRDIFVARYDASGALLWAKHAGGTSYDDSSRIAADGIGGSLVTGWFSYTLIFGAGESNETILTSVDGTKDIFVARYDANGALLWAKQVGGTGSDYGNGIAADGIGGSVVTGSFFGTTIFGAGEPNETVLTSVDGYIDIFVARYDASGVLQWATQAGGARYDAGMGIAIDGTGTSIVTGFVESTGATFGAGEPNETNIPSIGPYRDIFLARYDASGALIWARRDGGDANDWSYDLALDGADGIFVTGNFVGTPTFGAGEPNETTLTSATASGAGIFVARYAMEIYNPDVEGPITSNVLVNPNPVAANVAFSITADIDDTDRGGSNIASAGYALISGGSLTPMTASDGDFDEITEQVTATLAGGLSAGVYNVCVSGTDVADNSGADDCTLLAVYDPSAGFVTGGGWINSPAGAYVPHPTLAGKANFGFVAKYKKGQTVPDGNTEFQFKAGDLNFKSTEYEWLVVAGSKAIFKGRGTINGVGNYGFQLSALDAELTPSASIDRFRIKIWDKDAADAVVYDNELSADDNAEPSTSIAKGSIVIHKG